MFLCQFWKHTETHPGAGYTRAATWTKRSLSAVSPPVLETSANFLDSELAQSRMAPKAANPNPDRASRHAAAPASALVAAAPAAA